MTTAIRVSDSRVIDEMVDAAWIEFHRSHKGLGRETDLHRVRRCLEAALACQGHVTYVANLEELVRREGIYAGHLKKEEVVVPINFLYALIAKANGHE